jgi:predicted ATP-binding protein involved in virulence
LYIKSLNLKNFKCFDNARMRFQYPGRRVQGVDFNNVNLILGDNGGGKSSLLRALAIAVLAPALVESGFVPYRLVRRVLGNESTGVADLTADVVISTKEQNQLELKTRQLRLDADIELRGSNIDKIQSAESPLENILDRESSEQFFVVGYGATRRIEVGEYSESQHRRARGLRYARIAGLFEDHVAVRPIQIWANRLRRRNDSSYMVAVEKLNEVLPENIRFTGEFDYDDNSAMFTFNGVLTPLSSLSDGYKAFIGWVGDLIGHLSDAAESENSSISDIQGMVLIDEIDLHLHPGWQRTVLPTLAAAFPRLQFVFTTHSPLVASTVHRENVFVSDTDEYGNAVVKQIEEKIFGRGVEELLLSSYFNLRSLRPVAFEEAARELFERAALGDTDAALAFLQELSSHETVKPTGRRVRND